VVSFELRKNLELSLMPEGAQAGNDVMRVPLLHVARRRKSPRNRLLKDNK
jgi:hypothetical protein